MADVNFALSVTNMHVRYGAAFAVGGVSFDVGEGAVLALLGANGAGKSSVARACSGLVRPTAGTVRVGGRDVTSWQTDRIRGAGLVYIPEGRGVFPNLTVGENLRLAVRLSPNRSKALDDVFEIFPILVGRRDQAAGTLSGGEQQMLSMARALAGDIRVAIVDEPSLGLAPKLVDAVFESLRRAKEFGLTLVLIEQFAHRALALSDDCIILRQGGVSWSGRASDAAHVLSEHYLGIGNSD